MLHVMCKDYYILRQCVIHAIREKWLEIYTGYSTLSLMPSAPVNTPCPSAVNSEKQ